MKDDIRGRMNAFLGKQKEALAHANTVARRYFQSNGPRGSTGGAGSAAVGVKNASSSTVSSVSVSSFSTAGVSVSGLRLVLYAVGGRGGSCGSSVWSTGVVGRKRI